jgi:hypothetical protein
VNGVLYSGSGGQTVLQNGVVVGNVFSASPVLLQDRVHSSLIDSNAGVTLGNSDVIGATSTAAPALPAFPSDPITFTGTQNITVNAAPELPDVITLAPVGERVRSRKSGSAG